MTAPASKLLQPITVGPLELKNRIMFPPLTTGYEERDGSIGERSLAFYERLARGGVSYIVIGDVAPIMTASPTPKLATDAQIPTFKALADAVHKHGAKVAHGTLEEIRLTHGGPEASLEDVFVRLAGADAGT